MTGHCIHLTTTTHEETKRIGELLGTQLTSGMTIALIGDLGSGKTTFVQGLALGLDVPREYYVTSPTFTLVNVYPGRVPLHHVDLYRLTDRSDFESIGFTEILDNRHVVAIEWADRLGSDFLSHHLRIDFKYTPTESREICLTPYGLEPGNLLRKLEKSIYP
jgi:tRNA threonylcarbamoyladenosine biosynthesis protein TsaE